MTLGSRTDPWLPQGQTIIALLSDPLGRQWDVLGTAIVVGHVLSIWQAHRVALNWGLPTRRTALATLPLTVLMIVYTTISLIVIAAPMVNDLSASSMWSDTTPFFFS